MIILDKKISPHRRAIIQALFVTFLWSTSWVLIKIGLKDIPALTFAGLRYCLAFLCLLPFSLKPTFRENLRRLTTRQWGLLVFLGLLYYTVVQGANFLGLAYLPAATVSLIWNFSSLVVALMGIVWLAERPGLSGWTGIGLSIIGAAVFFYPVAQPGAQTLGVMISVVGMLTNAGASTLGRYINYHQDIPPLVVTLVSMGFGAVALLLAGGMIQGIPSLSLTHWAIIAWLAVVNTAFAFTLWNHTLRTLSAMESSVINSSMLVQTALLAWIFLGEELTLQKWIGLLVVGLGVVIVQLRRKI
jgi:drug/metabolite transporter (DMT)-like permease